MSHQAIPVQALAMNNVRLRQRCAGVAPLSARLEPWMESLANNPLLHDWVARWGSPLNLVHTPPLERNLVALRKVADERQVNFQVYFARKANKCLTFVDTINDLDSGIDTASESELLQAVDQGITPNRLICTAAIKNRQLLALCVDRQVTISIDNADEFDVLSSVVKDSNRKANVALRISGFQHQSEALHSRFGIDISQAEAFASDSWPDFEDSAIRLTGIHFHLDGYSHQQRVSAIEQSLRLIQSLRRLGHPIDFLDIGGGFPMNYLTCSEQWSQFWTQHETALRGQCREITYNNHLLGRTFSGEVVSGQPNCYPDCQAKIQSEWFAEILDTETTTGTVADAIRSAGLELRCEPGRSLLDGCGVTVARVEYRKQHVDGHWLIGLSMNRTQCRTTHDEFLVDPLLIPADDPQGNQAQGNQAQGNRTEGIEGYFVGAYCTESELISLRRFRFPTGVAIGDLVMFPNTAGYLMHFEESRSHQFPLAKNIVISETGSPTLDAIDV